MSLATKNVVTVLVGLGLVMGLAFAFAVPAKADMLSDLQAQVQALLAQISALSGGSSSSTSGAGCYTFTMTEQLGSTGGEVMWVQKFLNAHGAMVSSSGAGSPGNESSYYGAKTKAAVAKWQGMNGVAPAVGYWGPLTRAKANAVCAGSTPGVPGIPGVPVTGNGLKVALAADSPNNVALVAAQAIGELGKFTLTNPTGSEITVTSMGFKRIGTSADSTISNVYLFNGAVRLTDAAGVSNALFTFNDTAGIIKIPAGGSVTVSVRADILTGTGGQQMGVQLVSVAASSALDTSVVLPITGGIQTISSASMGTVAFTYTGPSNATDNPTADVRVFEASTVVSTHAAWLKSMTFEDRGSDADGDLKNFKLFVDGTQVGTAVSQASSQKVVFDLSANPKKLETGTRIIKVVADVVGGSGKTYDVQIRRAADAMIVDAELDQPILTTDAGGSFPVSAGTANTIGAANLSITRKTDSPSGDIAVGATNILIGRYEVRASGENVKVDTLTASTTVSVGTSIGLDNGKIFLNGVQIGSTNDIAQTGTDFAMGSSFIARAGQTEILEVYADAKNTSGTNIAAATTIILGVAVTAANTEGMSSGDSVTSANLSAANIVSFTRTITASSVTMTKNSGYGNQTVVSGSNGVKLGSFTLSTGSTEGVNVNTITVTLSTNESGSITDLMLKDSVTGAQIGTTKGTPGTSNSFSVNVPLAVSSTKTVDVFGNLKSSANAGPIAMEIDGSGTGSVTASSVTFGSSSTGTLQTITIASTGTLTTTIGVSPDNANVIAGSSMVKVGSFNFTAANSDFTVQEVKVKIGNQAATSVGSVVLKYKDKTGVDQSVTQALTLSSGVQPHATATYTGLTFFIPMNTTKALDVYVSTPTVASGATSGQAITATLDGNEGFKASDSAGNATTTMSASPGDVVSSDTAGRGTMYVRKSIPTLSAVALDSATLTAGSDQVLGRVKVTADAAGDIDWGHIVFTFSKTAALDIGATTTVALWDGSTSITGTFATTSGSLPAGTNDACDNLTSCLLHFRPTTVRTIPAGESRTYELRGTVGGIASGANNISVSIANPQSTATTTTTYTATVGTNGVSTVPSFAWSDWSDNSDHASSATGASTLDWTGDFLVKTLPLTVGNRSVNF